MVTRLVFHSITTSKRNKENYKFQMKNFILNVMLISSLLLLLGCTKAVQDPHAETVQKIHVHGVWVRAVPAVSHISAAYLTLINHGEQED